LAGLFQAIQDLRLSASSPEQIPELADMLSKLPPEVKSGDEAFNPSDPAVMQHIQDEVKELLRSRLLRRGGGS
jgi:hypothetical protein